MISYRQSSWPLDLRTNLIYAGCDEKVATVCAKAFGELLDHVTAQRKEIANEALSRKYEREINAASVKHAKNAFPRSSTTRKRWSGAFVLPASEA
jgi:hypothetical protein